MKINISNVAAYNAVFCELRLFKTTIRRRAKDRSRKPCLKRENTEYELIVVTAHPEIEAHIIEANATTLNNLASRFTLELLISL